MLAQVLLLRADRHTHARTSEHTDMLKHAHRHEDNQTHKRIHTQTPTKANRDRRMSLRACRNMCAQMSLAVVCTSACAYACCSTETRLAIRLWHNHPHDHKHTQKGDFIRPPRHNINLRRSTMPAGQKYGLEHKCRQAMIRTMSIGTLSGPGTKNDARGMPEGYGDRDSAGCIILKNLRKTGAEKVREGKKGGRHRSKRMARQVGKNGRLA